ITASDRPLPSTGTARRTVQLRYTANMSAAFSLEQSSAWPSEHECSTGNPIATLPEHRNDPDLCQSPFQRLTSGSILSPTSTNCPVTLVCLSRAHNAIRRLHWVLGGGSSGCHPGETLCL